MRKKSPIMTKGTSIVLCLSMLTSCNLASSQPVPVTPLIVTMEAASTHTPTPTLAALTAPPATATSVPATPVPATIASAVSAPQQQNRLVGEGVALYLRDAPDQLSSVLSLLNTLALWEPVGRSDDAQWVQIRLDDGRIGWLTARAVMLADDIGTLPITGESQDFANVLILPPTQAQIALYNAPDGTVVHQLNPLTPVQVGQRTADNAWLQVVTRDAVSGWLPSADYDIPFDLATVPVLAAADGAPQNTPQPPSTSAVIGVIQQDAGGLRLRQLPSTDSRILFNMQAGTELIIQGRITDNSWVLVEMPEGFVGWTAAQYLDIRGDLAVVQAIVNPEPAPVPVIEAPEDAPSVGIVSSGARQIYLRGQEMGNRRNVFTTVGDSLTDTPYFLRPIPGGYDLGDYGYLLPALQFFNVDTGYGNAFARKSFAAQAGWAAASTLELQHTPANCDPGETAVACEFRLLKPSVALIMVGTNDAPAFPAATYGANMQRIIDIAVQYGVVPVVSTLPPRTEFNERINEYNGVIRQLAASNNIPLWDFHSVVVNLPGGGLGTDGIHLSVPPGAPAATMRFTADNLAYGTTLRNLSALQMLNELMQQVLY